MINCGFFDSVNRDRLYRADEMCRPYELLVSNGVFATPSGTPSTYLQVISNSDMTVTVKAGRGIFKDKWFILDEDMTIEIDDAEVTLDRIDSIVVRVDTSEDVRAGTIELKKGVPATEPSAPAITRTEDVYEYRLADITVQAQATSILQRSIRDMRGSSDCPWVTSLIQQVDTSTLMSQWQDAYDQFYTDSDDRFDELYNDTSDAFDALMERIESTVATQTLIRRFTSRYVSTYASETVIPINITQYTDVLDVLEVYINGLLLSEGVDYTLATTPASTITLTQAIDAGTVVQFVVFKSVDGSQAETVVSEVDQIDHELDITRITSEDGGVKLTVSDTTLNILDAFVIAGIGARTVLSSDGVQGAPTSGAIRYIGQMTDAQNGWIMAFAYDGSMYSNTITAGVWAGWRAIYEVSPTALWTGSDVMGASSSVIPSKTLSACAHGWILVWGDATDNADTVTVTVPKRDGTGASWTGASMLAVVPAGVDEQGGYSACVKRVSVYNDRLTGFVGNEATAFGQNVVLKRIYEY